MYTLGIYIKHDDHTFENVKYMEFDHLLHVDDLHIEGMDKNKLEHYDRIIDEGSITDIFIVPKNEVSTNGKRLDLTIVKKTNGELMVQWYENVKVDLPWRKNKDPYRVWISEIMLQQTQVNTVIAYYQRFMREFPTVFHLADADEELVLKLWEGLGYYSRARRIHECAKKIVGDYKGTFPSDYDKIIELPGIGPYTAGAISSIAFGLAVPAIDGNVYRVISRLYDCDDNVSKRSGQKKIEAYVRKDLPKTHPSDYNQGLMELGRVLCKGDTPACLKCPWLYRCESYKALTIDQRPVKNKKKPPLEMHMATLLLTHKGVPLVKKRDNEGLLAGLWGFPITDEGIEELLVSLSLDAEGITHVGKCEHTFSHRKWLMEVYHVEIGEVVDSMTSIIDNGERLPLPTAFKKVYECYEQYLRKKSAI